MCEHNLNSLVSLSGLGKGEKTALTSVCHAGGITTIAAMVASARFPGVPRNSGSLLKPPGKEVFSVMKREKEKMSIFGVPGQQNEVNSLLVTVETG